MRRSLWLSLVAVLAVLTGCADTAGLPDGSRTGPQVIASPSGGSAGCTLTNDVAAVIDAALQQLYIKNLWPDANSVKGKFQAVKDALAAGDLVAARAAAQNLIDFIENKFGKLSAADKAAVQSLVDQVITDINCFVGIYDLNPGDPETAFQIPGVGGVNFPANVVAIGTQVTITETQGQICPLNTSLDCFSSFLSIELSPPAVLPQPAVVVLCPPNLISTLAVAHQDQSGFEILTPTTNLGLLQTGLNCPTPLGQTSGSRNWLTRVANFLAPKQLEAAPMMYFLGGIGGLTTKFSPFGLVNTTVIGTGGLGGKTTSFTPPAAAAPNAAPPVNPPLPASYLQGNAGTSTTSGLPFVTIQTPGGDDNGVNPVAGITVTFKTGPATAYELDSDAKVCGAGGVVPASGEVQVVTDGNGVATLPCLAFGNKAGFANLSATFDPATLNFPNANLVTITAIEGTSSGNSLNWLVKSNSLQASALSFVTAPSGSAGAGVAFAQQPKIQLLDALGNEVYTGGVTVTASVTAGGGTASFTGPITTDADGVATFTDLSIGGPAGPQTLTFTLGSGTVLDHVVQLSAGPASQLAITTAPPASAGAGVAFGSPAAVTIRDQFGNTTASTATVTAQLASGAGGTLAGTTSVDAVAGVATFADLKINGTAGDYTLEFKSGALTSPASTTIAVGAGPAAKLAITTQPSSTAQAGVAFGAQPVVVIRDQFDNQVSSSAPVVASLASGTGGTLAGTTSVNATAGTATFTNLEIDGTAGNFTLEFKSGALTSPASGTIALGAGPAAKLVITTQPSSTAAAGVAFAAQPVVAIRDQFDNVVNSGAAVTASLASGAVTLAGNLSATASGGIATFAGLRIDGVVGARTLKFSSGGIDSPASGTVTISAGAAATIMTFISGTAAQSYNYGNALTAYSNVSPAPQVIVKDVWGNPVAGQPVSWTASTSNGGVLTIGAGTPTTAAGTAQVSSWLIGDGLNQATASLSLAGLLDAQFTATTPTGVSVFACAAGTGGSKTDLGGLSIKAPNGTIKKVTLWMSITGTSSGLSNYGATFEARLNGPTGTLLKSTTGNVNLPGDNGNAVPVTFTFPTSIAKQSASSAIWFKLTVAAPSNRKPQVWYSSATFKSNETCFDSKAFAPGSTTTFKRGLSINVTN